MRSRSLSLTGATGFLGWHLTESFLRAGWDVRAIVRPASHKPLPQGARIVESDLSQESLARACAGTDVLIHNAAVIRAPSEAAFNAVNVEGTRSAAVAATRTNARLVLISSQAAGGPGTPGSPRRESDPPAPVNAYGRSKLAAESIVRNEDGLRWTILRPCAVYGPRDRGFLPLFAMGRRGLFFAPSAPAVRFTLIYVADLVRAVAAAVDTDAAIGETLFVGHPDPKSGEEVLRAIAAAEGRPFHLRRVPASVFSALAALGDLYWKLGRKPLVDSGRLAELRSPGFVCSVDRARHVLGFEAQTPLDEGIRLTAAWYRDHGWM
jgi:dihydroflavonol-4-reductase